MPITAHKDAGTSRTEPTATPGPVGLDMRRRTAAYWYAAGIADGTGDPDHSEAFARYAERDAVEYHTGRRSWLASIPEQFATFLAEQANR